MTRTDEDLLLEFRDQQRVRYLMPTAQLAVDLARERGFGERELFGASLIHKPDTEEERQRKEGARFPDEIAALRAFVRACVVLDGANGQMTDLAGKVHPGARGRRRGVTPTVRASQRSIRLRRSFDDSHNAHLLDDFVDVGKRVRHFPPARLRLLVERYVFGLTAMEIASDLGRDSSSVGGQLGHARRALKTALADLLPRAPRKPVEPLKPPKPVRDKHAMRLASAIRHARKCLETDAEEEAS